MSPDRRQLHRRRFSWICACATFAFGLLLARGFGAPASAKLEAGTRGPAWPPPPADPCVVYVQSITGPADVGIKPAALSRLAGWITGSSRAAVSLNKPFGLALDDAGNLLITDTGASTVCCLERAEKNGCGGSRSARPDSNPPSPLPVAAIPFLWPTRHLEKSWPSI